MSLHVRDAGLLSLLVDRGRANVRHLGMPLGGAADRVALALGNGLVGNSPEAVALEVTLLGPTLEARHPTACVVFGAAFQSTVNGHAISLGTTFTLEPGDILRVGGTRTGCRGYLCVAGGFESAAILGSRSSLEPVRAGDVLMCRSARIEGRSLQIEAREQSAETRLRVLDGPQRDWFTNEAFFTQEYEVSPASNRMGVRFKGTPLLRRPGELVSEAVAPGAVQITNDGMPVVLGVDGQTIGGYAKIAHVIRADLDLLAQLRPGDRVRFVRVSPIEAEIAANSRAAFLKTWLHRLRITERQPVFLAND
ncbi:MAG: biotin-dependent carboxyltransferase family protein [Planctomycetes bacterium]|nr:biotin-dependent carboxyltransferase family protein [Planctomycetota bacterium]